jgi:hypothetical protein
MSETNPSGNSSDASGKDEKDQVSYGTFSKLLGEKKKLQGEFSEMKARLDEYEQGKLEAEGKLKEALENQKKLTEQFKNKNVEIIKTVSTKAIKSQWMREAEKLGCIDPELALKAASFDDLEVTEDFEFDNQKLVSKIQDLTKSKPHLFKKDFKLGPDVTPSNSQIAAKPLNELSEQEIKQLLRNAK